MDIAENNNTNMVNKLAKSIHIKKTTTMSNKIFNVFVYVALIFTAFIVLIPFVYMILTAFKNYEEIAFGTPTLLPTTNNILENFKIIFDYKKVNFLRAFLNTMFIFVLKTVGVVLTCSITGYAFARFKCRYNNIIFFAFVAVLFLPGEILGIPFYEVMAKLRLIDNKIYLPLWLGAWFGIDITAIFLFKQFFVSINQSLIDAAKIDGCNELTVFFKIVLPLAKSIIVTIVILYFVGTYNDIYGPTLYIRPNNYKMLVMAQVIGHFEKLGLPNTPGITPNYHLIACATMLSILPVLVFFFAAQKNFVQSLAGVGIKG